MLDEHGSQQGRMQASDDMLRFMTQSACIYPYNPMERATCGGRHGMCSVDRRRAQYSTQGKWRFAHLVVEIDRKFVFFREGGSAQ
jgi:hypothetical protein